MNFTYQGFELSGKAASGTIEATDATGAREKLRSNGVLVIAIRSGGKATPGAGTPRVAGKVKTYRRGKVSIGDLAHFFRQLSILVSTHTPLAQAIDALAKQTTNPVFGPVLIDLSRRVQEGQELSEAMAEHPTVFDSICQSMTAVGEAGGSMDAMLRSLADLIRQQETTRKAVMGAMIYPVMLVTLGIGALLVMVTYVLPQFEGLFASLQKPVPTSTAILMSFGQSLRRWWYIVVPCAVALGFVLRWWLCQRSGRAFVERVVFAAPKLGPLARSLATARLTRLLGAMLNSRIPLVDALCLAKESAQTAPFRALLAHAEDAVRRGQNFSAVLESSPLIAPSVAQAVASGEQAGQLAGVLVQIADYLDQDNQQVVKTVSSILEPIILTVLGIVIGGVALSMFLPLFDLAAAGNSGGGQ